MRGRTAERQLSEWMERDGNWRMKALLAAALPDSPYSAKDIGDALTHLSERPKVKKFHLSKRDVHPRALEGGPNAVERSIRPLSYPSDWKEPQIARSLAGNELGISKSELETGVDLDRYMGRMLTSDSASEKDVLWREQLLDTVIQGAEEMQVAREASTIIEVNTQQGDHPVRGADRFAKKIARGASIPFDEENYSTNAWTTDKYGLGAYVTEELIDQAVVDAIELEIRGLGRAVENQLNRVFLTELVDNADSNNDVEVSPSAGELDLDDLSNVITNIEDARFPTPDSMVVHPEAKRGVLTAESNNNLLFVNRAGTDSVIQNRNVPDLLGMNNAHTLNSNVYNGGDGSNTWGYNANGEFGAVLYSEDLFFTYMRRDLSTKDFDDPIRDLQGANVRAEFDAVHGQTSAAGRIKH